MEYRFGSALGLALISLTFATTTQADNAPADEGLIDQARLGIMDHELTLFLDNRREDGVSYNAELLFKSPSWLAWAYAPKPQLGVTYAPDGNATSFAYASLAWDRRISQQWFVEGSLGMAIHDGETDRSNTRNELGCRWNSNQSISLGYDVDKHHRLMLTFQHISNADLCDENAGITNLGVRYSYRF